MIRNRGPREFPHAVTQSRPSLLSRERRVVLLGQIEDDLHEIRLLGVIEADAQSASLLPERYVHTL